ncbi:MAG TPA: VOC family protein [Ilumatobacteraceae bacterium]
MPDVEFKDLCIDVTAVDGRAEKVANFWGAALEQPVKRHDDGGFSLEPPPRGDKNRSVWINEVAEPLAGKSRVHIDIRTADGEPAPLIAAGGILEREKGGDIDWHVVDDPDGIAVCVFGPHPADPSALGPFELVVDAVDPPTIAAWWAARAGGTVHAHEVEPFVWIDGVAGFPYLFWVFQAVPEPKMAKNRMHWDVKLVDATIDDLVATGAKLLRPKDDEIGWWVMADPEGNEFCAFD